MPTENGDYLVTIQFGNKHRWIDTVYWANNLYEVDKYDFFDRKKKSGFYKNDSEVGHYEVSNVLAWCKVEPYEGE